MSRANPVALIGGDYDIFRTRELAEELYDIEPHSDVWLDLATTEHLDCASIGVLMRNFKRWRARDPEMRLRLLNVAPRLAQVLRILRLDELFIVETLLP